MGWDFWQIVAAVIIGNGVTIVSVYALIRIDRHETRHGSDEGIPAWPYFVAAIAPGWAAFILFMS